MSDQTNIKLGPVIMAGLAFGSCMGVFVLWFTGRPQTALEAGLFCSIGFGVMLQRFMQRSMSTTTLEVDGKAAQFEGDETLLHSGPANHFRGIEAVGGKLFLTSQRLRFRSHKLNVQNHDESYLLSNIRSVEPSRTLGLVPNGLLVHMQDGTRQRFVVQGRAQWLKALEGATRA